MSQGQSTQCRVQVHSKKIHNYQHLTPSYLNRSESESLSVPSTLCDPLRPHGQYSPWDSPGQNTGVGCRSLLQGIFPTQGSNPGLPHCRQILYQLSHQGSPLLWWRFFLIVTLLTASDLPTKSTHYTSFIIQYRGDNRWENPTIFKFSFILVPWWSVQHGTEMRNSFFSLTKCALCIVFLYKGKRTSISFVWNSQPIPAPGGENIAEPS